MDLFKQQLQRIQEQLGALTASQRMLALALTAISIMTLLWWGRYAATPEMVPVLDLPIAATDMPVIKATLQAAGISVRVVNDRVMVPAERHMEALGALGYARVLPTDTADAWDEIINQKSSLFEPAEKSFERFKRVKELMLGQLITSFPQVRSAKVILVPESRRRLSGGGDIEPSASVVIEAAPHAQVATVVDGAAATVASAQAGLKVSNVSVVVNGRPFRPRDPADLDTFVAADHYSRIQELERGYIDKIAEALPFTNALITVSVALETQSSRETRKSYDPKQILQAEIRTETEASETTTTGSATSAEPGAQANVGVPGLDAGPPVAGGGGGSSTTTERQSSQFQVFAGESLEQINKPGGDHRVLRAAVRLPRSHFVGIYKRRNGGASAAEPDDLALEPLIAPELEQVKGQVLAACHDIDSESVSVGVYDDVIPADAAAATEALAAASEASVGGLVGSHAKEIAIGGLAVLSLFMVSMMVRRGAPVMAITAPIELQEVAPLATDEDIAGEVGEGSAMLDGMELDEDTIKAQQMVEQVSTMVKENPDAAASLVKRWLNRS